MSNETDKVPEDAGIKRMNWLPYTHLQAANHIYACQGLPGSVNQQLERPYPSLAQCHRVPCKYLGNYKLMSCNDLGFCLDLSPECPYAYIMSGGTEGELECLVAGW